MRSLFTLFLCATPAFAGGKSYEVTYPPSDKPGELVFGVTYKVWIPDGAHTLRGVIVHQHGCGTGACKGGETAADDLHWQALAKKWDFALLGPSYKQPEGANCRLWCDPRNGSAKTFLRSLSDLAKASNHPELDRVPWCLWGHSGGGFWASLMQTLYPDRIVAIWCRSGTAISSWEKGEIPKPELSEAVYRVPVMLNPGAKEKGDKRFNGAWTGSVQMFDAYRAKGAPIAIAPDPRTAHECGDSRYLAIPFFDACLAQRLPAKDAKEPTLRPVDLTKAWYADSLSDTASPAARIDGKPTTKMWLPDEAVAKAWSEYVKTGATTDTTPPPAPTNVKVEATTAGQRITWNAEADFESGLQRFLILRDGTPIGSVPEKPVGRFGRPLFQSMSYHDTPEPKWPAMEFLDPQGKKGAKYEVISVNSAGLKSK